MPAESSASSLHLLFLGEEHDCFELLAEASRAHHHHILYASTEKTAQSFLLSHPIDALFFGPDWTEQKIAAFLAHLPQQPRPKTVAICSTSDLLSTFRKYREELGLDYLLFLPLKNEEALLLIAELSYSPADAATPEEKQRAALRAQHDLTLYERLSNIQKTMHHAELVGSEELFNALRHLIHKTGLKARSHGYWAVFELCKQWEMQLTQFSTPEQIAQGEWKGFNSYWQNLLVRYQIRIPQPTPAALTTHASLDLYLVDTDLDFSNMVRKKALQRGWQVVVENDPQVALKQLKEASFNPRILIVNRTFTEQAHLSGFELLQAYRTISNRPLSTILGMIFQKSILEERISAARQGVELFLIKPLSEEQLFEILEGVSLLQAYENAKVLLVDAHKNTCETICSHLEEIGCNVKVLHSETTLLNELEKFQPDLLILSQNLPDHNGIELLRILKSDVRYQGLPIIITAEAHQAQANEEAYLAGADDYVVKPIAKRPLQIRVNNFVHKKRIAMVGRDRDPLTAILNRRAFYEMFQPMLARSMRAKKPLVVALLDCDHFKLINDQYGHAAGDELLMRLGMLLSHSFRRTDLLGRWGGEEFVLCLEDISLLQAQFIVGDFLEHTSRHLTLTDQADLKISLSAGLAEFPVHGASLDELMIATDRALYLAKQFGRNRLIVAPSSREGRPETPIALLYEEEAGMTELSDSLRRRGFRTTLVPLAQWSESTFSNWPSLIIYQQKSLQGSYRALLEQLQSNAPTHIPFLFLCNTALEELQRLNPNKRLMSTLKIPAPLSAILELILQLLHQRQLKRAPLMWETRIN